MGAKGNKVPRVAVCMNIRELWGRERMFGFLEEARTRNWRLFRVQPDNQSLLDPGFHMTFDGVVIFDCRDERLREALCARSGVRVALDSLNTDGSEASVFMDAAENVRMAAGHLRAVGFGHLAYCGFANHRTSDAREAAFLEQTGGEGKVFRDPSLDNPSGLAPLMRWLKGLPKPAGVLTCDDRLGERVLEACRWAGLRVPEEVGVIGGGNDELICGTTHPGLSSTVLPSRRIGRIGAEMLGRLMAGGKVAERLVALAPVDVVARGSTDRLPAAREAVLRAMEFMRAECHRPIGVEELAAAAGVSRRTLDRAFAADTGLPAHEHLTRLRLGAAKQLLRRAEVPLGEVPARCGYLSLSAFAQMFHGRTGMTPREFRERHGEG